MLKCLEECILTKSGAINTFGVKMVLKTCRWNVLIEDVIENNKKIVIYGAGMIGKIVIPSLACKYRIADRIDCYIDGDFLKVGGVVKTEVGNFEVRSIDYLNECNLDRVILISNSNFYDIVNLLDGISNLNEVNAYLYPLLAINNNKEILNYQIRKRDNVEKIPRIIHYFWFGGGKIPTTLQLCLKSWGELCPDYRILRWDESNYNVNKYKYTREAYQQKRYGFVTDMARLDILYNYGGIYFDTDVTLLKRPDVLLYQDGFIATEKWGNINSGGGCGFTPHHFIVKELLEYRKQFNFIRENGSLNVETNGWYETSFFCKYGFLPDGSEQVIKNITLYPSFVFHPYDYISCESNITESTISIHNYSGSWMDKNDMLNRTKSQNEYYNLLRRIKNRI